VFSSYSDNGVLVVPEILQDNVEFELDIREGEQEHVQEQNVQDEFILCEKIQKRDAIMWHERWL